MECTYNTIVSLLYMCLNLQKCVPCTILIINLQQHLDIKTINIWSYHKTVVHLFQYYKILVIKLIHRKFNSLKQFMVLCNKLFNRILNWQFNKTTLTNEENYFTRKLFSVLTVINIFKNILLTLGFSER